MNKSILFFLLIVLTGWSFTFRKSEGNFFQKRKSAIDKEIAGFQPSENLYYNNIEYFADKRFTKNKYYVRQFKSAYGDIFSDTLNGVIRYMLVQGDCEVWLYYTKGGKPFKIDFLKMFGGTVSYYLIDKHKICIVEDNRNQSWCTRDTSSLRAELWLDRKRTVFFQCEVKDFNELAIAPYFKPKLSQRKIRAQLLERFRRVKNGK